MSSIRSIDLRLLDELVEFVRRTGYVLDSPDGLTSFGSGKRLVCMDGRDLYNALAAQIPISNVISCKIRADAETASSPRYGAGVDTAAAQPSRLYALAAPAGEDDSEKALGHRARVKTLYYRKIFNSDDAKVIVPDLLRRMDATAEARLATICPIFIGRCSVGSARARRIMPASTKGIFRLRKEVRLQAPSPARGEQREPVGR